MNTPRCWTALSAFFHRSLNSHKRYRCRGNVPGCCDFIPGCRNSCQYCRFQKCLNAGMSLEAIKIGRYSTLKRHNNSEEIKTMIQDYMVNSTSDLQGRKPDTATPDEKKAKRDLVETDTSPENPSHSSKSCFRPITSNTPFIKQETNSLVNGLPKNSRSPTDPSGQSHSNVPTTSSDQSAFVLTPSTRSFLLPQSCEGRDGSPNADDSPVVGQFKTQFRAQSLRQRLPFLSYQPTHSLNGVHFRPPSFQAACDANSSAISQGDEAGQSQEGEGADRITVVMGRNCSDQKGSLEGARSGHLLKLMAGEGESRKLSDGSVSWRPFRLDQDMPDDSRRVQPATLRSASPDPMEYSRLASFYTDLDGIIQNMDQSDTEQFGDNTKLSQDEIYRQHMKHLESCSVKLRFFSMEENLEVDDGLRQVDNFQQRTEKFIRCVIRFARCIPGFLSLHASEQVELIKWSRTAVGLLTWYPYHDVNNSTVATHIDGEWMCRKEIPNEGLTFFDTISSYSNRVRELELRKEEVAIMKAMLITTTNHQQMQINSPRANAIHKYLHRLLEYACQRRGSTSGDALVRCMAVVEETNTLGTFWVSFVRNSRIYKNPSIRRCFQAIFPKAHQSRIKSDRK